MANRTDIQWSVDKFNSFLTRFGKTTGVAGPIVLKKFMTTAVSRIVQRTPVASGDARYGWSAAGTALGIRVPRPTSRAKYFDPGEYEERLDGNRIFIRIVNNIPYIIPLEYGWSKQAPLGMVRLTLAELRSGEDISKDLMEELKAAWEGTSGSARYRANRRIMSGMLANVKDQPLSVKPKPDIRRRTR
jgi:hypothetical protein